MLGKSFPNPFALYRAGEARPSRVRFVEAARGDLSLNGRDHEQNLGILDHTFCEPVSRVVVFRRGIAIQGVPEVIAANAELVNETRS